MLILSIRILLTCLNMKNKQKTNDCDSNVGIHNINKIERSNARTFKSKYKCDKSICK